MEKSVQQLMDEHMCRPGYRWNDTLKRCLAAGAIDSGIKLPELPADPEPPPGQKPGVPAKPVEPPKKGKGGRGDVRVNANGISQTGTGMGKSIPVK